MQNAAGLASDGPVMGGCFVSLTVVVELVVQDLLRRLSHIQLLSTDQLFLYFEDTIMGVQMEIIAI